MPYIKQAVRDILIEGKHPPDIGGLNYIITKHILEYLKVQGRCYTTYNAIIGMLDCIKMELYRREIAPYEDMKMKINGDVYK